MSISEEGSLDPDIVSLVSQADCRFCELEEMTSVSDASGLDQLGADVDNVLACCKLSSRITVANRPGLDQLLDVTLSEEFSKYSPTILFCFFFQCGDVVVSLSPWVLRQGLRLVYAHEWHLCSSYQYFDVFVLLSSR